MSVFITVVASAVFLASMVAGGVVGVSFAERIQLTPPVAAPSGALYELGFTGAVWSLRTFIFILMILVVSTPVSLVLAALLSLA